MRRAAVLFGCRGLANSVREKDPAINRCRQGATEKLAITTAGASDVVVQQVTIQPGGRTGWHTHAGKVLAVVKAGTLTRYTADCKAVTYPAGQAFVETEGVHEGRNQGTVPVELYVTYIDPAGSPLKTNAIAPACGR